MPLTRLYQLLDYARALELRSWYGSGNRDDTRDIRAAIEELIESEKLRACQSAPTIEALRPTG